MKRFVKPLCYVGYSLLITTLFLYLLFPSARVRDQVVFYVNQQLAQADWPGRISLENLAPAFPPGISLYGLEIAAQDDSRLNLDRLSLYPGLLSLWGPRKGFSFRGNGLGGEFKGEGSLGVQPRARLSSFYLELNGIRITAPLALPGAPPSRVEGALSGRLTCQDPQSLQGEAVVRLDDARLVFLEKGPLDAVRFNTIDCALEARGQRLEIKDGRFSGSDVDGELSGQIFWQSPMAQSRLSLQLRVRPHPDFFARLRQVNPAVQFLSQRSGAKGIPIRIEGTLANPRFHLQ